MSQTEEAPSKRSQIPVAKTRKERKEQLDAKRYSLEMMFLNQMEKDVGDGSFDAKKIEEFKAIYGGLMPEAPDNLSQHEKVLDRWRVIITLTLIVVLAIAVILVVRQTHPSAAAAAYVSLISGLAGIALGWMFANSADPAKKSR